MAIRANKSFKLPGGTRLNLSRKGVGLSVGVKGARVGVGPRGVTKTVSIPGTGIRHTTTTSTKRKTSKTKAPAAAPLSFADLKPQYGKINFIIFIVLSAIVAILLPIVWLATAFFVWGYWSENRKGTFKAEVFYNKAIKLLKAGQFAEAVAPLESAVEAKPSDIKTSFLLVTVYTEKLGEYSKALPLLDYGLANIKNNAQRTAYTVIKGYCLIALERFPEAITTLRSEGQTENELIVLPLAEAYIGNGEYNIAIELLKALPLSRKRTVTPELIELKYLLGWAYLLEGDTRRAHAQLDAVKAHNPDYRDLKELLA